MAAATGGSAHNSAARHLHSRRENHMVNPPQGMHLCPTRIDGEPVLFAHIIDRATCQKRQREHYHKCSTCEHLNARASLVPKKGPKREENAKIEPAKKSPAA